MRTIAKGKESSDYLGESWYGWHIVELDEKAETDEKGNIPEEVIYKVWEFIGSPNSFYQGPGHWFAGDPLFHLDDDGLQILVVQSGGMDV